MIESTLTSSTGAGCTADNDDDGDDDDDDAGCTAFLFTLVYAIDGDPETGDPALEIRKRKEQVLS